MCAKCLKFRKTTIVIDYLNNFVLFIQVIIGINYSCGPIATTLYMKKNGLLPQSNCDWISATTISWRNRLRQPKLINIGIDSCCCSVNLSPGCCLPICTFEPKLQHTEVCGCNSGIVLFRWLLWLEHQLSMPSIHTHPKIDPIDPIVDPTLFGT